MSKLEDLLDAEAEAAEQAEESGHVDEALPEHVQVTRGHPRSRTLQIRLRDEEFSELEALAADRGLPVSTVARQMLLQSLAPEEDLKASGEGGERVPYRRIEGVVRGQAVHSGGDEVGS